MASSSMSLPLEETSRYTTWIGTQSSGAHLGGLLDHQRESPWKRTGTDSTEGEDCGGLGLVLVRTVRRTGMED